MTENYRRMVLVDPSIADDGSLETGMTLTCFAKRAKEIPDPQKGDVLIMRDVSVSNDKFAMHWL